MKLSGIFCAAATPFDHRGELYPAKIRYNVSRWNRTGLAGYLVAGPPGENAMLGAEEIFKLWEEAAQAAQPEKLLLAYAGRESVRETVRFVQRAAETGYHAAVVEAPRCCASLREPQPVQMVFFRSVADQAKLPLILSNPADSRARLSSDTVTRLGEHPNILAVHDQGGDAAQLMELLRKAPAGFQVLTGSALTLYPCLFLGAHGAFLALANAAPFFCLSIEEAVRTREYKAAHELQNRGAAAVVAVSAQYGVAGLKYAMDLQGYYGGAPRLPLLPLKEEAKREMEEAFRCVTS